MRQYQAGARNRTLSYGVLLELKRWNTPTIYNGWEQITRHDTGREGFNPEETHDFMPWMGPMVGYALTVVIQPGNPEPKQNNPNAWADYLEYVASVPPPKIIVIQDLDKPLTYGSFWGEVTSNTHRALGCVGTIVDGAIRDVDEMTNAGLKALARRMCVGHAHSTPWRWDCEVEVFGTTVRPGQLIHADKHGFLAIPEEDEQGLLEAARFMDANECQYTIAAARSTMGKSAEQTLEDLAEARRAFGGARKAFFSGRSEW